VFARSTAKTVGQLISLVVTAEVLCVGLHVLWSAVSVPVLWRALGPESLAGVEQTQSGGTLGGVLLTVLAGYVAVWAPAGGIFALAAAWGLHRRRRWARTVALTHAIISLPSLVLSPLASFVLYGMTRPAARAGWTGSTTGAQPTANDPR
jgi:hypothetical protein